MGTLSKLCNFVRAYCGQTVEVFVLPCYHSSTSFSSPPPPLELHLRAKSYHSSNYPSFLQSNLRTEKQQRPDYKDSHIFKWAVWCKHSLGGYDCKTCWKTHRIEAKDWLSDKDTPLRQQKESAKQMFYRSPQVNTFVKLNNIVKSLHFHNSSMEKLSVAFSIKQLSWNVTKNPMLWLIEYLNNPNYFVLEG